MQYLQVLGVSVDMDKLLKAASACSIDRSITLNELIKFAESNGWSKEQVSELRKLSPRDKTVQQVLNYDIVTSEKINLLLGD